MGFVKCLQSFYSKINPWQTSNSLIFVSEIEQQFYRQLKNKVSERVRENHIVSSNRIEDWKGKDIEKLNIDLAERVKGNISEKCFYTHLKVENEKLPRIDMLDMLSEYVGFDNWLDFREKNKMKNFLLISFVLWAKTILN